MDDNKIKINIYLNGQQSSLTIHKDEEEDVRAAAKRVNDYLLKAKKFFESAELDEKQLLAMIAYQLALTGIRAEKKAANQQFITAIENWDKLIEEKLSSNTTDDIAFVSTRKKEQEER